MSPQTVGWNQMSLKCDIWSLGVIFYNLITGTMPFMAQWPPPPGRDQQWWEQETMKVITSQDMNRTPAQLKTISRDCSDLLETMLCKDASKRPDAAECSKHSWFENAKERAPILSVGVLQCLDVYSRLTELKKAIFLLMAHQSALPCLDELRAIFTHFDETNNGIIDADDLRFVLTESGMTPVNADRVIHALDRDGDGTIGWTEFIAAAICVSVCRRTNLVDAAFANFDSDGDDEICKGDFMRVLAGNHGERWREKLSVYMAEVSKDRAITKEQFRSYVGQDLYALIQPGTAFHAVQ
jgi:hypothetical protein